MSLRELVDTASWTHEPEAAVLDGDVLRVRRGDLLVVLNCGDAPAELPAGEVLVSSGPLDGVLPPATSAWLRV